MPDTLQRVTIASTLFYRCSAGRQEFPRSASVCVVCDSCYPSWGRRGISFTRSGDWDIERHWVWCRRSRSWSVLSLLLRKDFLTKNQHHDTGSVAAAAQSAIYGGATGGLFSILQSIGATAVAPSLLTVLAGSGAGVAGIWFGS